MQGTLTAEDISGLIGVGAISGRGGIDAARVQPSSLDLTLGCQVYRMPGSTLPLKGEKVQDIIDDLAVENLDAEKGVCLARGRTYLVALQESLALPAGVAGYTNSKSSTGRIDLATRVLCDSSSRYDRIPSGYKGALWVELTPRSFDVVIHCGDSVNQALFFGERKILDQRSLLERFESECLLYDADRPVPITDCVVDGRIVMGAQMTGDVIGYVAKRTHLPLVLRNVGAHKPQEFFTPITAPENGYLFLEKDRFYILATKEKVVVPLDLACEMVPYDAAAGEFRAHYAGFFDPGWGLSDGCRAVLEVRPHEDDLILRHGQPICAMAYEELTSPCAKPYGTAGNNYAGQDGPRLSKHFSG